ncbi:tRNA pseudouridine(38-40) synthase TruA [Eubacteriaceae bacterium ES3]|nr:tRNA pseudouridine(38-40) synthase TruA [Eubacteriaceae bacterium ES3]
MKNVQLIIAYRGSKYNGWQTQPNGLGVQEVLQKGISAITGEKINLTASGRTDAGVHALGQSAHFFTNSQVPVKRFPLAINAKLPDDIRVLQALERPHDFHSRYSATEKTYTYKIRQGKIADPFLYDLVYQVPYQIDWDLVKKLSEVFIGKHDFIGFMASGSAVKTTIREIKEIKFYEKDLINEISFTGNGFLYNMVRIMVGTLLDGAYRKKTTAEMSAILASGERKQAGPTAPACGLYLKEVKY